ncbi:unnamed protein product [Haemonchus placei]|uniref:Secreted protein n=1 Tax=Haemonchus placei TaxID=6290 RepID=A0A0N4VUZ6_HAEPC|nr:unnamed protein product [Haemonchus placei]
MQSAQWMLVSCAAQRAGLIRQLSGSFKMFWACLKTQLHFSPISALYADHGQARMVSNCYDVCDSNTNAWLISINTHSLMATIYVYPSESVNLTIRSHVYVVEKDFSGLTHVS